MKCPVCHTKIQDRNNICPNCGYTIKDKTFRVKASDIEKPIHQNSIKDKPKKINSSYMKNRYSRRIIIKYSIIILVFGFIFIMRGINTFFENQESANIQNNINTFLSAKENKTTTTYYNKLKNSLDAYATTNQFFNII